MKFSCLNFNVIICILLVVILYSTWYSVLRLCAGCLQLLLLLIKHYNLYKVLACSTAFFQLSLFFGTFFQLHTFMFFISSKTSSSQHVLGLPIGLLNMGFHLLILCTILSSAMHSFIHSFMYLLPYIHLQGIPRMWRQSQYNTQYIC